MERGGQTLARAEIETDRGARDREQRVRVREQVLAELRERHPGGDPLDQCSVGGRRLPVTDRLGPQRRGAERHGDVEREDPEEVVLVPGERPATEPAHLEHPDDLAGVLEREGDERLGLDGHAGDRLEQRMRGHLVDLHRLPGRRNRADDAAPVAHDQPADRIRVRIPDHHRSQHQVLVEPEDHDGVAGDDALDRVAQLSDR